MHNTESGAWRQRWVKLRARPWVNIVWTVLVPTVFLVTMEWIHRGTLGGDFWSARVQPHPFGFIFEWVFLLLLYLFISRLSGWHWLATLLTGIISNVPGTITWFKLEMRGEPFLPWDITQVGELAGVADKVTLQVQPPMLWSAGIFVFLLLISCFIRLPSGCARRWVWRGCVSAAAAALWCLLVFGVYLNTAACEFFGIYSDMWMQDRYYKNYGVITGFMTNLQALDIDAPDGYTRETVETLAAGVEEDAKDAQPLYEDSYAATAQEPVEQPNIIFVMNESFWDVSRLAGIEYDRELTPNLTALKNEGAYGYCYTPSFGGGTCDVEFEALTGFSVEHLPAGSKPYQQHVTQDMFSLPQYLRAQGYDTVAVHGYYRKFWSRNTAYPYLGFNAFIAAEDFTAPDTRRGFISDAAMTERIIEEYESRAAAGPVFIHAVTMQNHTTYDESRYPADELVQITEHPGLSQNTLSQLRDFATGVYEADAALGRLVEYFRNVDEPTIIVFWGDHFNPVGKGYELYEKTGYIGQGDTGSPNLRQTDLLIWSNYDDASIDLGTLAAYNISPVMMDLYGLNKPLLFSFLSDSLSVMRARTRGITVEPDGSFSEVLSEAQQQCFEEHWLLQYDLMFGRPYLNDYTAQE